MTVLVSDETQETGSGTLIVQTILNGGTATFYAKLKGMSDFSLVKELSDEFEYIGVGDGEFKVVITGSAEVAVN